ncbi:hypothetical protein G647_03929 [Cladophialophora carrionii CBS 160.54]|uniref:Uncharacterized protein n=1 Tax=Cladophialophora carrionii CBS 160.54 TaxID=1279043 RepID=V9DCI3_9EURO|nr:uncharacterized protein G647_03929 [Cladophialophora carrionii CBS 160.54]ETI24560.1 hypothetical protein G647_03929 [Cladophialophora carrionii CBS 160.54]
MKTFTLTLTSTSYLFLAIAATARLAQAQSYCDASVGYVLPDSTSDSGTDTSGYTPDSGDCDAECQLYYSQQQTLYSDYFNDAVTAGGNSFLSAAGGKRKRDHLQHHTRRASSGAAAAAAAGLSPRQSGGDGSDGGDLYLTCTAAETCFVYENIPLCIDMATGDFTDPTGGSGNVLTGTYNAAVDTGSSGTTGSDDDDTDSDSGSGSGSDSTDITSSGSSSSASSNGASSSTRAGGITLGAVVFAAVFALLAN